MHLFTSHITVQIKNVPFLSPGNSLYFNAISNNQKNKAQETFNLLSQTKTPIIISNGLINGLKQETCDKPKRPDSLGVKKIVYDLSGAGAQVTLTPPSSPVGGPGELREDGTHAPPTKCQTLPSVASSSEGSHMSRVQSDGMSNRSIASIGMGSTDGKRLVIRKLPQSPEQLLNIVNSPT